MLLNVAIDAGFGLVPILGDLFDVAWKANERNVALLEQYGLEERRPSAGDWLFVAAMIAALAIVAALPFLLAILLVRAVM
jgi:hypothetical protein